jgi:hypothetical protein
MLNKDPFKRMDIFEIENILLYEFHWTSYEFVKLKI